MIEAVTAAVSNSQLVRVVAEQTSTTQSYSSNPTRVQSAAITAPYLSPHVDFNGGNSKPIFVVRDLATGEHIRQFPTEGQIRAYQQAQANAQMRQQAAAAEAQFRQSQNQAVAAQKSADLVKSSVEFRAARQEIKVQQHSEALPGQKAAGPKIGGSSGGSTEAAEVSTSLDTQA